MSASQQPRPVAVRGPHEDRGHKLIAVVWTLTGVCVVFQLLRLYVRWTIRQMGADDYWMFFTTAIFIAYSVVCTLLAAAGGERHAMDLWSEFNIAHIEYIRKLGRIAPVFIFSGLAFGKISVALLMLRYLRSRHRWQRWFLVVVILLTPIIVGLGIIFNFVQCNPVRALWDFGVHGDCWHPRVFLDYAIFGSSWSAATDIALSLLPTTFLRRAHISPERTAVLLLICAVGLLAGAIGIYKATQLPKLLDTIDFTWCTYTSLIYTAVELCLIIIAGTLPTFTPLWDLLLDHVPLNPYWGMTPAEREAARRPGRHPHHTSAIFLQLAIPTNIQSQAGVDDASKCAAFMAMLRATRTGSRAGSWTIRMDRTIDVIWSNGIGPSGPRKSSIFGSFSRKASIMLFRSSPSSRKTSASSLGTTSTAVGSRQNSRGSRGSRKWSFTNWGSPPSRNASVGINNTLGDTLVQYQSIRLGNQSTRTGSQSAPLALCTRANLEHISETQSDSTRTNTPNDSHNNSRVNTIVSPLSPLTPADVVVLDRADNSSPPPSAEVAGQIGLDEAGEHTARRCSSAPRERPRVRFRTDSIWSTESSSQIPNPEPSHDPNPSNESS